MSKSITSKFVSTSDSSGMRAGEEVQWLACVHVFVVCVCVCVCVCVVSAPFRSAVTIAFNIGTWRKGLET